MKLSYLALAIVALFAGLSLVSATGLFDDCGFSVGVSYSSRLKAPDGPPSTTGPFGHVSLWLENFTQEWNQYWHQEQVDYAKKWDISLVMYGYLIAARGKSKGFGDCDVSAGSNLCTDGANLLTGEDWTAILARYEYWASQYAKFVGGLRPMLWNIEPDFFQYSVMGSSLTYTSFIQKNPVPNTEMVVKWKQICSAIRKHLPTAYCGLDISPWMHEADAATWYGNFKDAGHVYMFTSGGRTAADNDLIRPSDRVKWKQIYELTGKPILADAGYGIGGGSDDSYVGAWRTLANAQARNAQGVMGVTIARTDGEVDYAITETAKIQNDFCALPKFSASTGEIIEDPDSGDDAGAEGGNAATQLATIFACFVAVVTLFF